MKKNTLQCTYFSGKSSCGIQTIGLHKTNATILFRNISKCNSVVYTDESYIDSTRCRKRGGMTKLTTLKVPTARGEH